MSWRDYLSQIQDRRASGQATEHSYRSALESLLEEIGGDGVDAINDPSHGDYGAPDFIVQRNGVPIGHVECKNVGINLNAAEESEQLRRYKDALPNLILTDYLEFRWYVGGKLRQEARLGRFDSDGRFLPQHDGRKLLKRLLKDFFNSEDAKVSDPAELAQRMAGKARLLRDSIEKTLERDKAKTTDLQGLLKSYQEVLISDLDASTFADLQAQTAAYGLFAARCIHTGPSASFTRQSAVFDQTTPFLSNVFNYVAGPSADPGITWIVDDLAHLLARADMEAILKNFGSRTRREDPVVHFYEDFLHAYDSKLRELRGVYYTPEPVVSYIVRSVDKLLRTRFGLKDGLADTATVEIESQDGEKRPYPRVLILDPAAGTGTFLREAVSQIRRNVERTGAGGMWEPYVKEHLLPRLFGFELLMAPYAVCHLKLALEIGGSSGRFTLPDNERLRVYLTNSLEEAHEAVNGPMFAAEIARESSQADAVKRDKPVMVVIGNPPYSGHSANKGEWIRKLLRGQLEDSPESYFKVDGQSLGERNPKWLNDDYVKFIRFAQWRIEKTGEGVLGFVTNHSYLDNSTFRGMRQSLMNTFDEIRLLDLHGSARKRERAPDGGPDENVFDIQQGVSIGLFVKRKESNGGPARVFHADLWGQREGGDDGGKYGWLAANDVESTHWKELSPRSPQYLFVPMGENYEEYEKGWKLTDILPVNSVGIVTARDKLAIQWTEEEMRRVAADFARLPAETARERYKLRRDSQDWKVTSAQQDLNSHPDSHAHVRYILYRPFDVRFTYYTRTAGGFICRPRPKVMQHMLAGPNVGLIVTRQASVDGGYSQVLASQFIVDNRCIFSSRGIMYQMPLYTYPSEGEKMDLGEASERSPNLAPEFTEPLENATGLRFIPDGCGDLKSTFGPEDAFHYIYAVLHSPEYRRRYADFLKSDFPRIPVPTGKDIFASLARLGAELAALHLMETDGTDKPTFPISGSNRVDRVSFVPPAGETPGRVWINNRQHFEGVSPETWAFTIGGYRPAEKWLKDRRRQTLTYDNVDWYRRVCAVLSATPSLMARVDEAASTHGGLW